MHGRSRINAHNLKFLIPSVKPQRTRPDGRHKGGVRADRLSGRCLPQGREMGGTEIHRNQCARHHCSQQPLPPPPSPLLPRPGPPARQPPQAPGPRRLRLSRRLRSCRTPCCPPGPEDGPGHRGGPYGVAGRHQPPQARHRRAHNAPLPTGAGQGALGAGAWPSSVRHGSAATAAAVAYRMQRARGEPAGALEASRSGRLPRDQTGQYPPPASATRSCHRHQPPPT
jgi:hypothetical protein